MREELEQIGPRLRAIRQAHGLTLEELAAASGMSASTLSRLESGKRQASLELLLPLTRRLGLRLDDLIPHNRPTRACAVRSSAATAWSSSHSCPRARRS